MASKNVLRFSMRAYRVGAEEMKAKGQAMASTIRKAVTQDGSAEEKQVFWMRDPKTGYYIPENHFDDVDVADLRDKFLSKKH